MKIHILTLFPGMFDSFISHSMIKKAIEKKILDIRIVNLRDYTRDKHKTCDDRPFGGGPGMVMKPEPIFEAADNILGKKRKDRVKELKERRFIYLTPQGERLTQKKAKELSRSKELIFLCGHYEGVDERVIDKLVTDEISIGDYVLTGGELPAMVVIDAVARHIKGVLGKEESLVFESFDRNLLEYPQYTRPAEYRGLKVPSVLLSGNHQVIERWREKEALERTKERRPDLFKLSKKRGTKNAS